MSDPKIRVACLGAGYFSRFHYDSWARMGDICVVGACDLNPAAAEATGVQPYYDLDQMLTETRPDLLDIIVPPAAQVEAIRTALRQGIRWIICQKPFCVDLSEARRITREADEAGATLIIHENVRFQPWYRVMKEALEARRIGQVQQITFRLRPGDGQGPRAYLDRQPYFQTMPRFLIHETGVHWIDTFRFLLGTPEAVYADLRRLNPVISGEDAGVVVFDLPHGARAIFDANRHLDHASDNPRRTMGEAWIEGTSGTLRLSGDGAVWLRSFGRQRETQLLAPDTKAGFGGDCVHALQSHVIAALRTGEMLENRAGHYLSVLEIEAAIYLSAETGRKIALNAQ